MFPVVPHDTDFCVVGGGMAGLCAAIAAARHGARVLLMHERPVLGGNASSECRMHVCGADRSGTLPHLRETGILEELRLENLYRNPLRNFSAWDLVLYDAVIREPGITLLLNCSCCDAEMDGKAIRSVTGWQMTTQTYHKVTARIFADCSGDSVLAPLTGAPFKTGRESRSEFGESIAPEHADRRTMGMTCMFQARRTESPVEFRAPSWAYRFDSCDSLPYGARGHGYWETGYWWIELGGEADTIRDTETLRNELLRITLGVWDHIKNSGHHDAANWALEWLQFLPGKRESRRYLGDHILTQLDIEQGGPFQDTVAFGGWSMDDHDTAGFRAVAHGRPATIFHPAPSPYRLPYRILYSSAVTNLMFAGRNASCTHSAMSSTRVMGTCAAMGQAVGTAAAMAAAASTTPRSILARIGELQSALMDDDCYLPGMKRDVGGLSRTASLAASASDPEPVRDGVQRQVGNESHSWLCPAGGWAAYRFRTPTLVNEARLVLDSAMDKLVAHLYAEGFPTVTCVPQVVPHTFRLETMNSGSWKTAATVEHNRKRLVRVPIRTTCEGIRFVLDRTWGAPASRVYEFTVT